MKSMTRRRALKTLGQAMAVLANAAASAAESPYPARNVTLVVPFPPGGPTDVTARLLADRLGSVLGRPIVIDNRAGASGNLAAGIVARANPDGYTLLFGTGGTHGANPALYKDPGYDPIDSFAPVVWVTRSPNIVVVNPSFPAHTIKDLIDLAKAEPGKLSSAAPGYGSTPHMAGELFKIAAGIDIVHVPYRGSGPALNDVLAGHIPIMFDGVPSSLPLVRSGQLRALAITALERLPSAPEIPTIAETIPGFEADGWFAVYAPAGTPQPIISRLNEAINEALQSDELRERYTELGAVVVGGTPQMLRDRVASEVKKWAEVVAKTGIKLEN
jgi:tripartite-type tricarboxylate transporter receptor subunit TctC